MGLSIPGTANVPNVTEISCEKGRRKPTGAALRLLDLARKKPNILQEPEAIAERINLARQRKITS